VADEERDEAQVIADEIIARGWDGIEALEHAGYVLFPEKIWRRTAKGKLEAEEVLLRVPREHEMRQARIMAREWAKAEGVDPDKDPELFESMDCIVVLARFAVRNPKTDSHEPLHPDPAFFEQRYDRPAIEQTWSKLEAYRKLIAPQARLLDRGLVIAVAAAIAKGKNTRPLVVFDGPDQDGCVIIMADLLTSLLTEKSSRESSATSTPVPSSSTTSSTSSEVPT
jgi:hypothetical protein